MKKQLVALTFICVSLIFTDCNKKSDPQPSSQTPAAPTTASGYVVFDGTTRNLTIYSSTSGNYYDVHGDLAVPPFILGASFPGGKPTASKTITLSGASSDPVVYFQNAISEYRATSATVTVTVIGTTVTVEITNATFKDRFSSSTVQASGKLVTLN